MKHPPILGTCLAVACLLTVGCERAGPDDDDASPPATAETTAADSGVVRIVVRSGSIRPDTTRVAVGRRVTLVFESQGDERHELLIGQRPALGSFLIPFFAGVDAEFSATVAAAETDAGRRRHERSDTVPPTDSMHLQMSVPLQPGEQGSITFIPPAGHRGTWIVGCTYLDHFERGERATLVVE